MRADAAKAREDSLAAVMAVDPYAYGDSNTQELRARARQQWEDFREIILEKWSVCQPRQLLSSLLTQSYKFCVQAD